MAAPFKRRSPPPSGYVIYDGPSMLTGAPIVCIATVHSTNDKTGDMLQVWYLLRDVDPLYGSRSGADIAICGHCPSRGIAQPKAKRGLAKKRKCYVDLGRAPLGIYRAYQRGNYPRLVGHAAIAALGRGRKVRLGAYGDPAVVPAYVNESLLCESLSHTAYSHQIDWDGPTGFDPAIMMVSADSLEEARAAWARGARTYRVVGSLAEMVVGMEAPCPASEEMRAKLQKHIQCTDCMLCGGGKVQAKSMVIPVHGAGAKYHAA